MRTRLAVASVVAVPALLTGCASDASTVSVPTVTVSVPYPVTTVVTETETIEVEVPPDTDPPPPNSLGGWDLRFISALRARGLEFSSDGSRAAMLGRSVCEDLSGKRPFGGRGEKMTRADIEASYREHGWDADRAAIFIDVAIELFCPSLG